VKRIVTAESLRSVADRYIRDAFAKETRPQVAELAAIAGFTRADFTKLFTHIVGETPSSYMRREQIACAKNLLATTTLSMNAIAYRCGFGTRTSFFRAFKRAIGMTPKQNRATAELH